MNKIQVKKNQKVFFTSDTHYNHSNLCSATTEWVGADRLKDVRDFKSLSQMNDTIVNNINAVVGCDDILIHLGDISFGGTESFYQFIDRINCKNIHLILGNHDEHIEKDDLLQSEEFVSIAHYREFEIIYPQPSRDVKIPRFKIICSHYPMASWNGLGKGRIHLHGHLHLNQQHKLHQGKSMDVGVDGNNFKPYQLEEIIKIMENQPIKFTTLKYDHHAI